MNNEQIKTLTELGIDTEDAVKRFMGNEALYLRMLKKLPASVEQNYVSPDFDVNNLDSEISRAHTIKGNTGNLSVTPLYKAYTDIVSLMRENKPEEAREILKDILPVQEKILTYIKNME